MCLGGGVPWRWDCALVGVCLGGNVPWWRWDCALVGMCLGGGGTVPR